MWLPTPLHNQPPGTLLSKHAVLLYPLHRDVNVDPRSSLTPAGTGSLTRPFNHPYRCWSSVMSTANGFASISRTLIIRVRPLYRPVILSSDPAFVGMSTAALPTLR